MTNEDEIELIFGVSDIFFYKFDQNFIKNMYFEFEPGQITFPCFTKESVWFQMIEFDETKNDVTMVTLDCDNLQIGQNVIEIKLYENAPVISTSAKILKSLLGSKFDFLLPSSSIYPAIYDIHLNVTDMCTELHILS